MNVGHENELEDRWHQRINCINYEVKKVYSFEYLQGKIGTNRNTQEITHKQKCSKIQNWRHIGH
jgi:hypothetical protein